MTKRLPPANKAIESYKKIFEATGYPDYRVLEDGGIATENCSSARYPNYALIAPNGNCRFYQIPVMVTSKSI